MISIETLPKTETYTGRKKFNKEHPDRKDHINMTKLIDSLIKVAIHMKEALKEEPYLDFKDYVAQKGINFFASSKREYRNDPVYAKGILQSEGVWSGRKLYPFFEWSDSNKKSYGLRQGKVLESIFKVISEGKVELDGCVLVRKVNASNLVSTVEELDMWFNS